MAAEALLEIKHILGFRDLLWSLGLGWQVSWSTHHFGSETRQRKQRETKLSRKAQAYRYWSQH